MLRVVGMLEVEEIVVYERCGCKDMDVKVWVEGGTDRFFYSLRWNIKSRTHVEAAI